MLSLITCSHLSCSSIESFQHIALPPVLSLSMSFCIFNISLLLLFDCMSGWISSSLSLPPHCFMETNKTSLKNSLSLLFLNHHSYAKNLFSSTSVMSNLWKFSLWLHFRWANRGNKQNKSRREKCMWGGRLNNNIWSEEGRIVQLASLPMESAPKIHLKFNRFSSILINSSFSLSSVVLLLFISFLFLFLTLLSYFVYYQSLHLSCIMSSLSGGLV